VEAIRHLEGDHLFSDEPPQQQEMPLALTTGTSRMLKVEVSPMDLGYRPATTTVLRTGNQIILPASALLTSNAQQQQQRPGVIVVKHTWTPWVSLQHYCATTVVAALKYSEVAGIETFEREKILFQAFLLKICPPYYFHSIAPFIANVYTMNYLLCLRKNLQFLVIVHNRLILKSLIKKSISY
jgi:hypothetical protein